MVPQGQAVISLQIELKKQGIMNKKSSDINYCFQINFRQKYPGINNIIPTLAILSKTNQMILRFTGDYQELFELYVVSIMIIIVCIALGNFVAATFAFLH